VDVATLQVCFNFCGISWTILFQRICISRFTVCLLSPAARRSDLLFFASVLALLAPLLAVDIENLERLKVNLDDIANLHSGEPHPGMCFLSYIPELCSSKH